MGVGVGVGVGVGLTGCASVVRLGVLSQRGKIAKPVRQTPETLVCCAADGSPLQPRSLTHAFSREVSRSPELPRVRLHDLRHTHATQLLLDGVHPKVAQERLGHSSISTTLDLYSHVTETMQQDAAQRLDAALGRAISAPLASK